MDINPIQNFYFPLAPRASPYTLPNWEGSEGSEEFLGKEFINSVDGLLLGEDHSKLEETLKGRIIF